MSKPKDRRGEFARQHKRILQEQATLLERLAGYETEKEAAVAAALAPVQAENRTLSDQLDQERARSARFRASNEILERDLATQLGGIRGLYDVLERERADRATETAALEERLARVGPDLARLAALVARWEGKAKKKEYEEASAILNRQALAQVVPAPNRRP